MTNHDKTKTPSALKKSQPKKTTTTHNDLEKLSVPKSQHPKNHQTHANATSAIIVLIAMGAAIYAIYTTMQLRHGTKQEVQLLRSEISQLKQQQIETTTKIDTTVSTINESQDKLQSKLTSLDTHLQSALQQQMYQAKDWLLLKARYYLELAQINANWGNNLQATAALLQQADILLANFHDQQTLVIREAIAKEIADLNTIPKLDLAGLLIKLDRAQAEITDIPLKPIVTPIENKPSTTNSQPTTSDWRERLKDSVGLLEKVVVIRHHDEEILPLPSPAYESMLREGIRLNLQEAQWAALQNNEAIYQFSLAQALKNINRSFEAKADSTVDLVKQLQSLQKLPIMVRKPSLDTSLPLLNKLIESKNSQLAPTSGENS